MNENHNENKRRKALNDGEYADNESDLILYEEKIFMSDEASLEGSMSKVLRGNEAWFCPRIAPPLVSELEEGLIANNEPIVQFYKKNKKFKMVYFKLIKR